MNIILGPLLLVIQLALNLYVWVIIVQAVMSWLVAFGVVNTRNRFVYSVGNILYRLTEPALAPIRRILPDLGGIDLSPVVLLLVIVFIQNVLGRLALHVGVF